MDNNYYLKPTNQGVTIFWDLNKEISTSLNKADMKHIKCSLHQWSDFFSKSDKMFIKKYKEQEILKNLPNIVSELLQKKIVTQEDEINARKWKKLILWEEIKLDSSSHNKKTYYSLVFKITNKDLILIGFFNKKVT